MPYMNLFEEEFGAITVTEAEGWSAQQGEASLNSRVNGDEEEVIETSVARNAALEQKNKIAIQMLEREYASSVERVVEVLNELPGVKWSPFHLASVDHFLASLANRQGFMVLSSDEDKISYLKHRTGTKLYD
ncbi:hypothetical protein EUTSA_v10002194mg [Eutrema salsugineum]|uniref:Uncharacterized protein n=1 Tax=Eutrema salsugineum TaxID=72664 RepID=V4MCG2_EUTSA|nr:hypothetical protein EUTSA_v10002194mg [Eutrema salsugineum]